MFSSWFVLVRLVVIDIGSFRCCLIVLCSMLVNVCEFFISRICWGKVLLGLLLKVFCNSVGMRCMFGVEWVGRDSGYFI